MRTQIVQHKQCRSDGEAMATWSDEALIRWTTNKLPNWRLAFTTLTTRHNSWIFQRCLFRLGNHHDAQDAVQDIVWRLYNCLHQFQGRSQFKSWLNTIITNYCNTFAVRRAKYVTREHIEQLIDMHEMHEINNPHASFHDKEIVDKVLCSLPENTRQVLSLRFYAEHSLEEMANVLSISLSATKARLYRAIEQFKKLYLLLENNNSNTAI